MFEVKALTWDGRPSFAMVGQYGQDEFGRFVLTPAGVRFDIPSDAIVARAEVQQTPMLRTVPAPEPAKPEPATVKKAEEPAPPAPPKPCPLPRAVVVQAPAPARKPAAKKSPAKKKPAIKASAKKIDSKKSKGTSKS